MSNARPHSMVRTLLTGAAAIPALPMAAMRQLVACYSDWRRSRDILSDPDEPRERRGTPQVSEMLITNGLRPLRPR